MLTSSVVLWPSVDILLCTVVVARAGSWHCFFATTFSVSFSPPTWNALFNPLTPFVGDLPACCIVGFSPSLGTGDIAFAFSGARARLFAGVVGSILSCACCPQ
jgi:hypothetical protein